jgi:hypothetical protein
MCATCISDLNYQRYSLPRAMKETSALAAIRSTEQYCLIFASDLLSRDSKKVKGKLHYKFTIFFVKSLLKFDIWR